MRTSSSEQRIVRFAQFRNTLNEMGHSHKIARHTELSPRAIVISSEALWGGSYEPEPWLWPEPDIALVTLSVPQNCPTAQNVWEIPAEIFEGPEISSAFWHKVRAHHDIEVPTNLAEEHVYPIHKNSTLVASESRITRSSRITDVKSFILYQDFSLGM